MPKEIIINDMPKVLSPFVREKINGNYVVTPQIAEGMEWVFEDPEVMAVEKLDGTNVSVVVEDGCLLGVTNRTQVIECSNLSSNKYLVGIRAAYAKGKFPFYRGQYFGELMGPQVQKNFLKLDSHMWFSFDYLKRDFSYRSFHKYPKTFENISSWFQNDLFSLVYCQIHSGEKVQPEGIVFHHPDGRMAKLRVDMFDWYKGKRHKEETND